MATAASMLEDANTLMLFALALQKQDGQRMTVEVSHRSTFFSLGWFSYFVMDGQSELASCRESAAALQKDVEEGKRRIASLHSIQQLSASVSHQLVCRHIRLYSICSHAQVSPPHDASISEKLAAVVQGLDVSRSLLPVRGVHVDIADLGAALREGGAAAGDAGASSVAPARAMARSSAAAVEAAAAAEQAARLSVRVMHGAQDAVRGAMDVAALAGAASLRTALP
jgi:hypothetical protein